MAQKTLLILFIFFFLGKENSTFAQNKEEANTLIKRGQPIRWENLGFTLAPSYGIASIDGIHASLFHLRGGLTVNDRFAAGVCVSTSLNDIRPQHNTTQGAYIHYWTGGCFMSYTMFSKKIAHLSLPLHIGYGEMEMDHEDRDLLLGKVSFFQIEPSVLLEFNIHKNVRFNAGTGYRFVSPFQYQGVTQAQVAGFTGFIGLNFGIFR